MRKSIIKSTIFISYAWNPESETIVEKIEKEFLDKGISVVRDKTELQYKGGIKPFMEKIGKGQYVILVISEKYLKSQHCMFELLQIFKNPDFYDRIFPIVLDDVKISKATERLEFVKYWESEVDHLDKSIRELRNLSNIQGVTDELNLYAEIRNNIAMLTNILADINTLNTDKHIHSSFAQLFEVLQAKISRDLAQDTKFRKWQLTLLITGIGIVALLVVQYINPGFLDPRDSVPDTVLPNSVEDTLVEDHDNDETLEAKPGNNEVSDSNGLANENTEAARAQPWGAKKADRQSYIVELVIPSTMIGKGIFVDGEPSLTVDDKGIFIDVKVYEKEGVHHFEIRDDNGKVLCSKRKLISTNKEQLILCNN